VTATFASILIVLAVVAATVLIVIGPRRIREELRIRREWRDFLAQEEMDRAAYDAAWKRYGVDSQVQRRRHREDER
jgi:hypothetical protein